MHRMELHMTCFFALLSRSITVRHIEIWIWLLHFASKCVARSAQYSYCKYASLIPNEPQAMYTKMNVTEKHIQTRFQRSWWRGEYVEQKRAGMNAEKSKKKGQNCHTLLSSSKNDGFTYRPLLTLAHMDISIICVQKLWNNAVSINKTINAFPPHS